MVRAAVKAAPFAVTRLTGPDLPPELAGLAAEAAGEGVRIPARVLAEWAHGVRFDRPGEKLMAGWSGPVLAGIGGLTRDPAWPDALRMRRFYVHPAFRRRGLGRALAVALLAEAPGRVVTVNAGTPDAPAFWESLGFVRDKRDGHTHLLPMTGLPGAAVDPGRCRAPGWLVHEQAAQAQGEN